MTRRVIVPLDSSAETESVIACARLLTGRGGEAVLLPVVERGDAQSPPFPSTERTQGARSIASSLQALGVSVRVLDPTDPGLDDFGHLVTPHIPDLIACVAAGMYANSLSAAFLKASVPTTLCPTHTPESDATRLLVPLDGSQAAEAALPLAEELALEWGTPLRLMQAVLSTDDHAGDMVSAAWEYLQRVAERLSCTARVNVLTGRSVATMLVRAVKDWRITDVVLSSHGRSADPLTLTGSVVSRLIDHAGCRVVVVPMAALFASQTEPVAAHR